MSPEDVENLTLAMRVLTSLEGSKVERSEWISRKVRGEISSLVFFRRRVRRDISIKSHIDFVR